VLPARRGGSPTGLFAETAASVRASRRVASETTTLRANKIQIPRPAQLIQILILTVSYTRRQTLNLVKQFVRSNSDSLKNVDLQVCDLSVCRVQRIAGAIRMRQYPGSIFTLLIRLDVRCAERLLKACGGGI
jgi:hypothetical protein